MEWLLLGAVGLVLVLWAATYNRFVRLRSAMRSSWSGIDVELARRADLIPNLVETVKGYAEHERETLERAVEARRSAEQVRQQDDETETRAAVEGEVSRALASVSALSESYPQLKADGRFADLQRELATTEDRIAASRRLFNSNVKQWNRLGQSIPTRFARPRDWQRASYFEAEPSDRAALDIDLS